MPELRTGVDAGKAHHHGVVVDADGTRLLSRRVSDNEADPVKLIAVNRLRARLLEYFPALERAFDHSRSEAALVLLTGYPTPAARRECGRERLAGRLRERKVRNSAAVARLAVTAAEAQFTVVPAEATAAAMVARPAKGVMALDEEIAETDALIEERFRRHRHAAAVLSMPGVGPMPGAEFLALTGEDTAAFGSADRPAGVVSLSKAFYDRKKREGKTHKQAVLAPGRRRLNVLWALIRDNRTFRTGTPKPEAAAA